MFLSCILDRDNRDILNMSGAPTHSSLTNVVQGSGSTEVMQILDALGNVDKQLLSTEWRLAVEEYRYYRDFPIGNAIKGWKDYEGDLKKYGSQFNLGLTNTHTDLAASQDIDFVRGTGPSRKRGGAYKDSNISLQKSASFVNTTAGTGLNNTLALQSTMASMKKIEDKEKFLSYSSVTNTAKINTHLSNIDDADLDLVLNNGYTYPLPGQKPKFPVNHLKSSTNVKAGGGQSGNKLPGNNISSSGLNPNSSGNLKGSKFASSAMVIGGSSGPRVVGSGPGDAPQKKKRKRKSLVENSKNTFSSPTDPSAMDFS